MVKVLNFLNSCYREFYAFFLCFHLTGTEAVVITIIISSIVAVGVIGLAIYFVRKKQSRNLRVRYSK